MEEEGVISRRDFINGILVAAGSTLLGACSHGVLSSSPSHRVSMTPKIGDEIGTDPKALRGGNLPSAFTPGHWMRDRRLTFGSELIRLAPGAADASEGSFPIFEDQSSVDVIIVGSGMSGLASAFYILRRNPKAKILILDANASYGGNAARDDASPMPVSAATAGAYAVAPYSESLREFYKQIGLNWESHGVEPPFYNYFFDDQTPFALPHTKRWALDVYGAGLNNLPYPKQILRDLESAKKDFIHWYNQEGAPTDPADQSDPKYDELDRITLQDYLLHRKKYHEAVADFYTRFTVDALAGTSAQVSAYAGISFIGAEYHPLFALPGGNAGISSALMRWLVPDGRLDHPSQRVRVRQGSIVMRADTNASEASVVYFHDGKFYRARAPKVILATQAHTAQHIVGHLIDSSRAEAWKTTIQVPVIVANVILRRAAPLVDLGLGYNQYWWGSPHWADFVIADWVGANRTDRERSTVLTFYGGNWTPPEQIAVERYKLLTQPFSVYESSLRADLERVLAGTEFRFDRDVKGIYLYRWGHGMLFPTPGHLFGMKGGRSHSPRLLARQPIGRILFAGQDTEGTPSLESAIASGLRCAQEVLS